MSFRKNILPLGLLATYHYLYHSYIIGYIFLYHYILGLWKLIIFSIFFHIFFYMMMWSFLATWLQPTAKVPSRYRLTTFQIRTLIRSPDDKKHFVLAAFYQNKGIKMYGRTRSGYLRFCNTCFHFKPDRAHHCSQCDTCILKMDHHCQWLNTCIGLTNQKGFLLILFYCCIFCTFYVCTTFNIFIAFWTEEFSRRGEYLAVAMGFLICVILAPISGVFCLFHLGLCAQNRTLLEDLQPPYFANRYSTYDLGLVPNLNQVLGKNKLLWLFPIFNQEGPGLTFSTRKGRLRRRRISDRDVLTERLQLQRTFSDYIR